MLHSSRQGCHSFTSFKTRKVRCCCSIGLVFYGFEFSCFLVLLSTTQSLYNKSKSCVCIVSKNNRSISSAAGIRLAWRFSLILFLVLKDRTSGCNHGKLGDWLGNSMVGFFANDVVHLQATAFERMDLWIFLVNI